MNANFKPEGYNSVSPYIIVRDCERWILMMKDIFDAEVTRRYDTPDGTVMHAELKVDDSIIMFGEASEKFPANQSVLHVYVPDARAAYERALQAGCTSIHEPKTSEEDPDIRASFYDYAGNYWSVGTQKS
ncbi:MAG: hypothetical protein KL787_00540 [Taibaiella sp.]|nr:hypothetical protein [Taibaiella sp.]